MKFPYVAGLKTGMLVVACLLSTSCGGGDGGSPPVTGGPLPTPAPTGIPPRTQTDSYPVGYTPDEARNLFGLGYSYSYVANRGPDPSGQPQMEFQVNLSTELDSTFDYSPSARIGDFDFRGDRERFEGTDTTFFRASSSIQWYDPSDPRGSLNYASEGSAVDLGTYYAFVFQNPIDPPTQSSQRFIFTGVRTFSNDYPPSGLDLIDSAWTIESTSSAEGQRILTCSPQLTVDYTARTIAGDCTLNQTAGSGASDPRQLALSATFDPAERLVEGSIGNAAQGVSGRVIGAFYGPYAVDLALSLRLDLADGQQFVGTVRASR